MQDLLVPNAAHSTKGLSAYYGKKPIMCLEKTKQTL